ncbi:MAG: Uma2 family endonuclease [Acidimicrobiales bacterium]
MAVQPVAHRFTVDEYHRMAEALGADARVELLEGEIVDMAPIGSHHAACVAQLVRLFQASLGDRAIVWPQNPVLLGDLSEPQPDVALLRLRPDRYVGALPGVDDVLQLVEIGDASAVWDAQHKLPLYADAGVAEVWLVNLPAGSIEVCRLPTDGAYRDRVTHYPGDFVAPEAFPDIVVEVASILSPA